MWYSAVQALLFKPEIGMKVEISLAIVLFLPKDRSVQTDGLFHEASRPWLYHGAVTYSSGQAFKERGIFDLLHRPIPKFVNTVGVITSTEGRVVHDIQMTMQRRNDAVNIIVYPASVQGQGASRILIEALHQANNEKRCDV